MAAAAAGAQLRPGRPTAARRLPPFPLPEAPAVSTPPAFKNAATIVDDTTAGIDSCMNLLAIFLAFMRWVLLSLALARG
ncbi:MAG: hypothetical protein ACR2JC_01640 [Chloroflexota bacterium]